MNSEEINKEEKRILRNLQRNKQDTEILLNRKRKLEFELIKLKNMKPDETNKRTN
ncbi:MAG: hypothetical protein WC758_08055 [Candidatus Woesearchaeota archaeon]|jgi:hypothetical protein